MKISEDICVLQYYINSSTKGSRGWCWSVAMATYVQRTKLTASLTAPARAAPSTVCVSGRTPASATRATGARTALNVRGREGGRSQVTISYFLSQFARRGGGARTVPGSVSVPVAGSVTPTRAPARVPPAGSGPSVTQSVPRAPSAWTVQISAPVITMAR